MSHTPAFITCSALSFDWPDGTPVFEDFQLAVGPGRTGLIGVNGCGKSTLLKLIAGELTASDGQSSVAAPSGTSRRTSPSTPPCASTRRSASAPPAPPCTPSRRARPPRRTSPRSATTGTSRNAPWPPSTSSASPGSAWTARSANCPAAKACCCASPRCCSPAPTSCCWTSRRTTWTCGPGAAVRGGRVLVRGDAPGQPRPRAAGAGRPDRRPARRRSPLVRRGTSRRTRSSSPPSRTRPNGWSGSRRPTYSGRSVNCPTPT